MTGSRSTAEGAPGAPVVGTVSLLCRFPVKSTAGAACPDGESWRVDDPEAAKALSRAFDQPLTLWLETTVRHHDECAVHLVTASSIRQVEQLVGGPVDARRLRANIVLDTGGSGFEEDA